MRRRVLFAALAASCALGCPDARAEPLDPERAEASSSPGARPEAPPLTFLLAFGPTFGWYAGAQVGMGLAIKTSELTSIVVSPRLAGGKGWDRNPFVVLGGDVGVRIRRTGAASGVAHLGLGAVYMVEIEGPRTDYLYVAPHARFGGGFRVGGPERRFAWGVEGTTRLGYAFDVTDHSLELADVDYGGVYGAFEVSLVLEF